MPRRNDLIRRRQRQATAAANAARRRQQAAVTQLFAATAHVVNQAADKIANEGNEPLYVAAYRHVSRHHCPDETLCSLHPKVCAVLNQNMF